MATAYICPMCVFNCDNLPDLEKHLEAHESNAIQSPIKEQKQFSKAVRNSPLYAKSTNTLNLQQQPAATPPPPLSLKNPLPATNSHSPLNSSPVRSSPNKTYDRRYSCKSCPFSTHSVKAYFNHRLMAHGEQLIVTECPFCDYASQYPGKVKKHLTDEHPSQQMPADDSPVQSSRTSSRGSSLNTSRTMEHDRTAKNDTSIATRFTDCPFCSFTSMDAEEFRKHVLANHLSDKNFRCLVCNRLYRYRGDCSFHIRKKHSDRMIGDNIESLREYIGEFRPNAMTASELKDLLSCPSTPSLASAPSNGTPTSCRPLAVAPIPTQQPNPPHSFRCGYCKFSSVNSGDVKKHQTWKHANQLSNILPIDPNDPYQQPMMSYKRKRVHSSKMNNQDDDGPALRRPRISMPSQRELTVDTSSPSMIGISKLNSSMTNADNDSAPRDLLSPNEPVSASFDSDQSSKRATKMPLTVHSLSALSSLSTRVYKCIRCERLAPHRWIIERHIRAKHPADLDNMSDVILEIDKPLAPPSSTNGEPMTATKSSSSTSTFTSAVSSDQDTPAATPLKAFSCSACSLQSYHLWVVLRHIRNVHESDGSNAKIIDNFNNQIIEDNDDLDLGMSVSSVSSAAATSVDHAKVKDENNDAIAEHDEAAAEPPELTDEEVLKQLINTAMASRKTNATNNFLENIPASLINNNIAASLATLLGQLTNKQLLQQQQQQAQAEKAPTIKRYKCSLCSHISAWGGNVKKHLKRMHPGEHSGHVIDLGLESSTASTSPGSMPVNSDPDDASEQALIEPKTTKMRSTSEYEYPLYQQPSELINTKLKDIDNSPSFAPPSSNTIAQSNRPERLYGCSVCSYECVNPSNIHRHVELHSGQDGGGFQCSQCFFLSKWRASIRKHMMSTHGSSLASLTNVLEPLILIKSNDATVIVKKWLVHDNGIKHEDDPNNNTTHSIDTSNYYCPSCPYTNTNRVSFDLHVMHHNVTKTDETDLTCAFCTFMTSERESLDDHQVLHVIKEDFQQNATAHAVENAIVS